MSAWQEHPELIGKLTKLWDEGLSSSEIAATLGYELTKNSVIGKANRLNLTKRARSTQLGSTKRRKRRPKPKAPGMPKVSRGKLCNPKEKIPKVLLEPEIPKPSGKIKLVDLDQNTCRWPIGDPGDEDFHFCGARCPIDKPYCEHHTAIAWRVK